MINAGSLDADTTQHGPLAGVKVLDLSHIASGPFATMLLGDLGADVIKVERPGQGDGSRQMDISIQAGGESGYFLGLNKNKRSIALDLATSDGVAAVRSLAAGADVFIENFRPGAADRLGLGYAEIAGLRPDIVYCSITGFGSVGPLRDAIAYDIIGQAMSGIMSITGDSDRPPAKCGAPIADLTSGLFAAIGVLAALQHRARTGKGQHVSASLLGSATALVSSYVTSQALGTPFDRVGSAHNTLAPYQAFRGKDGSYFIVAAGNDRFFRNLVAELSRPDLAEDPRFDTNSHRTSNRDVLAAELQREFDRAPAEQWLSRLESAGVPVGPIYEIGDLASLEQLRVNGYIADVDHPSVGVLPVVLTPLTFSATPVSVRRPPPRLDQHRSDILKVAADPDLWVPLPPQ
jgi:crotonobetainyl-CoA:carnitine CoA-transferase CaiB-like acyl-CoA transferase